MRPVEFQYLGFLIDPNKEPWPEHDSADDNEPLPEHDSADDSERDADALARIAERDARSDSSGADVGSRVPSSIGISSAGPSASMLWLGPGHPWSDQFSVLVFNAAVEICAAAVQWRI